MWPFAATIITTKVKDLRIVLPCYPKLDVLQMNSLQRILCPLTVRLYRDWGSMMRHIHDTRITPDLSAAVPRENDDDKWLNRLDVIERAHRAYLSHQSINSSGFGDAIVASRQRSIIFIAGCPDASTKMPQGPPSSLASSSASSPSNLSSG